MPGCPYPLLCMSCQLATPPMVGTEPTNTYSTPSVHIMHCAFGLTWCNILALCVACAMLTNLQGHKGVRPGWQNIMRQQCRTEHACMEQAVGSMHAIMHGSGCDCIEKSFQGDSRVDWQTTACAGLVTTSSSAAITSSSIGAMAAFGLAMMTTKKLCSVEIQCKLCVGVDGRCVPSQPGPASYSKSQHRPRTSNDRVTGCQVVCNVAIPVCR